MSSTLPEAADGSQPASPDVLEELEEAALNMLASPDVLEQEVDGEVPPPPAPFVEFETSNGSREVSDDLDKDVADALEAELFGESCAGETDLFGEADTLPAEIGDVGEITAANSTAFTDTVDDHMESGEGASAKNQKKQEISSPDISETELFGPEDESVTRNAFKVTETSSAGVTGATADEADQRAAMQDPDAAQKEAARYEAEGPYDPKTSRFMKDFNGNLLHKWKVDYATRGGGGQAQCRDNDCLEKINQGGVRTIEKGCLRIGRRVNIEEDRPPTILWHHARCIFNTFLRARKTTRVIEDVLDIEGFEALNFEEQEMLRRIIERDENIRNVRFRSLDGATTRTPQKRDASGVDDSSALTGGKKRRKEPQDRHLDKGDRCWTFFRCLPKEGALPPGALGATVKSAKPELAMVREEIQQDAVIVQFESAEHEKQRIELYNSKRGRKIRSWLTYPRLFEGRKQRVPLAWIAWNRKPPALCGCTRQEWGHACDCGISCGRGAQKAIWGVGTAINGDA